MSLTAREATLDARRQIEVAEARRAAILEVFAEIERLRFAPHPSKACVDYGDLMGLRDRLLGKNSEEVSRGPVRIRPQD